MRGAIPPLPLYVFMAGFVKHRDDFTFTLRVLVVWSHSLDELDFQTTVCHSQRITRIPPEACLGFKHCTDAGKVA